MSPCGRPRGHYVDRIARPDLDTASEKDAQGVASITAPILSVLICSRIHCRKCPLVTSIRDEILVSITVLPKPLCAQPAPTPPLPPKISNIRLRLSRPRDLESLRRQGLQTCIINSSANACESDGGCFCTFFVMKPPSKTTCRRPGLQLHLPCIPMHRARLLSVKRLSGVKSAVGCKPPTIRCTERLFRVADCTSLRSPAGMGSASAKSGSVTPYVG